MAKYVKNLSEPWFSLIYAGEKTVEGRLNKGDFANMQIGDIIVFTNHEITTNRNFAVKIIGINYYESFKDYLLNEKLEKCLPTIKNTNDGIEIYYKYYSSEEEKQYGVKAFKFNILH